MPLTETVLERLRPKDKLYVLADRFGLGIRVNPGGQKTFQFRYLLDGKPYRIDIGKYPGMSLTEARDAQREAASLVERGINPLEVKQEAERAAKNAERDAVTVSELIGDFLAKQIAKKWKSSDEPTRLLRNRIEPELGHLRIEAVTRRDVVRILEMIAERAPSMANRTTSLVKQMFTFAVIRGYCDKNPCAEITRTSIGGPERPRTAYLSHREIWRLWHALPSAPFSDSLKIAVKLLLLTGQRRSELILARQSDIDWERAIWTIPEEHSKNGKAHFVPLAPLPLELFKELRTLAVDGDFLFPSPYSTATKIHSLDPHALTRAIHRWRNEISIDKFSPHVLRHTFATQVNGLGVALHVVEKILNHSLEGMLRVYVHSPLYDERVRALNLWSDTVAKIVVAASEDAVPVEPGALPTPPQRKVPQTIVSNSQPDERHNGPALKQRLRTQEKPPVRMPASIRRTSQADCMESDSDFQ